MISDIDLVAVVHALSSQDLARARERASSLPEPGSPFEEGYALAIKGMVASYENDEKDGMLYKILTKELSPDQLAAQREYCHTRSEQAFRDDRQRGYERAWEQVCAYALGDLPSGLDAYQ
ncbi:MAG: hypothetical protein KO463_03160 [Candidatus Methanofastidiosa archaeon]|nr:hypothetical protein [Candidatus Methanofastidiosa archaeon]